MFDKLEQAVKSAWQYWGKAVNARDLFYRGLDEAKLQALYEKQPNLGPEDAQYRFSISAKGKQLIADNKWHMAQSRTTALLTIASATLQLVAEQKQTNRLLKQLLEKTNGTVPSDRDS